MIAHFATNIRAGRIETPMDEYLQKMAPWFSSSFTASKQLRIETDTVRDYRLHHRMVKLERVS